MPVLSALRGYATRSSSEILTTRSHISLLFHKIGFMRRTIISPILSNGLLAYLYCEVVPNSCLAGAFASGPAYGC